MLYYIIGVLVVLLLIVSWYCIKFSMIVLDVQDSLEESLELLDQKYNNLSKILEIPIFYDSQEVKRAINEVEDARNIMLYIANRITSSVEEKAIIDEENDEEVW